MQSAMDGQGGVERRWEKGGGTLPDKRLLGVGKANGLENGRAERRTVQTDVAADLIVTTPMYNVQNVRLVTLVCQTV